MSSCIHVRLFEIINRLVKHLEIARFILIDFIEELPGTENVKKERGGRGGTVILGTGTIEIGSL
jgi:hypothetical protein